MSDSKMLTRDELREVSRIDAGRLWLALAGWWSTLLLVIEAGVLLGPSLWLVPLILLAGCLQNALILWTHEGSHAPSAAT